MSLIAPSPVEAEVIERPIGHPPYGNGHGGPPNGHDGGHAGGRDGGEAGEPGGAPFQLPKRRRSVWPFLLDLGLVMMLFGWIIIGRFLVVIGAVLFVVALTGWIREARAEFSSLRD